MSARIIQVPMDGELVERVSKRMGKRFRSRAEFIRAACEHFLDALERLDADARYQDGYRRQPEDLRLARVSTKLARNILPAGEWE